MTTRGQKRKGSSKKKRGQEGQKKGYRNECYYKYTTTTTRIRSTVIL